MRAASEETRSVPIVTAALLSLKLFAGGIGHCDLAHLHSRVGYHDSVPEEHQTGVLSFSQLVAGSEPGNPEHVHSLGKAVDHVSPSRTCGGLHLTGMFPSTMIAASLELGLVRGRGSHSSTYFTCFLTLVIEQEFHANN